MRSGSDATSERPHYFPAIDGLRAVAVAGVVAYHLGFGWAKGGYLGVDLFFVISGFLITGLLVGERERRGRVSLRNFYARRARRLLPALLLMLVVVAGAVGFGGTGIDRATFRGDVQAALGYVANWRFVFSHQGYFDQFAMPSPIRHTWSLAIEEQFYLCWPLLLLGMLRLGRGSRRVAAAATAALATASLVAMALLFSPGSDPSRVYYGTDTRAFELLAGAVLALSAGAGPLRPRRRHARADAWRLAGPLGLAGLVVMMTVVSDHSAWMYRGGFALACALAALCVWAVARPNAGWLGRALAIPPLRGLGRISYGVYLWHWPAIDLITRARTGLSGLNLVAVQVGATMAASVASYFVLELRVRSGWLPRWRALLPAAVAVAVVAMLLGAPLPHPTPAAASAARLTPAVAASSALASGARAPTTMNPTTTAPPAPSSAASVRTPVRVLIVGDSVMYDASPGIKAALEATGEASVQVHAVFGFGLSRPAYNWAVQWPRLISAERPDLVLALFGGWDGPAAVANGSGWYASLVESAIDTLTAGGARLVFLEYPHTMLADIPGRPPVDQTANERQRELVNTVLSSAAQARTGRVEFLPIAPAIEQGQGFAAFLPDAAGQPERIRKRDGVHFCPAGSERVGAWVLANLTAQLGLPPADPGWVGGPWRSDPRYNQPPGACG